MDVERERLERNSLRRDYQEIERQLHSSFRVNYDNAINCGEIMKLSGALVNNSDQIQTKLDELFRTVRSTLPELFNSHDVGKQITSILRIIAFFHRGVNQHLTGMFDSLKSRRGKS